MFAKNYTDLEIYKLALEVAKEIYIFTKEFPQDETYGMRDQIRRAAASIGANIAEGFGRYHYKDKLLFFYNARGSVYETMHFVELAFGVGYLIENNKVTLLQRLNLLAVKLNNFINSIGSREN